MPKPSLMRSAQSLGVSCAVALALSVPGAALAQTGWSGSSTPEELLYRLDVLDAEIADIRARLGVVTGRVDTPMAGTGNAALEAELRRLTAALERVEYRQNQLVAELNRRMGDIEYRLNELEGNPGAAEPAPLLGDGTRGVDTAAAPEVSRSERGDLDRAIDDVKQGRFDQAEERLAAFMRDYPGSPLLGEAWYWMGEGFVVRGVQAEAARSYLNGYESDRGGAYAAQNLFRLGVTLGRLGQVNEACLTLREVRNQFPNAPDDIPSRADAEADHLRCG